MTNTKTIELALTEVLGLRMEEFNASETLVEGELEITQVSFILSMWIDADLREILDSLLKRFYLMDGWVVRGLYDAKLSVTLKVVYQP